MHPHPESIVGRGLTGNWPLAPSLGVAPASRAFWGCSSSRFNIGAEPPWGRCAHARPASVPIIHPAGVPPAAFILCSFLFVFVTRGDDCDELGHI